MHQPDKLVYTGFDFLYTFSAEYPVFSFVLFQIFIL